MRGMQLTEDRAGVAQYGDGVATAHATPKESTMTVKSSVAVVKGTDPRAVQEAAALACRALGSDASKAALVLTSGEASQAGWATAREVLGRIPLVGGSVPGILTDDGLVASGAAVVCFGGLAISPSFAGGGRAPGLVEAADRAGRLILAGASHRRHFPRGVALAFSRSDARGTPREFLARWREIAGPKLRTVLSSLPGDFLYSSSSEDPGVLAVLCLEGSFQSGVGVAEGTQDAPRAESTDPAILAHSAADAALTAVKKLEGQLARVALIVENLERHVGLGAAARDEWAAMRETIGRDVPCIGWLTTAESAAGRGVVAPGPAGSIIVTIVGDAPPPPPSAA